MKFAVTFAVTKVSVILLVLSLWALEYTNIAKPIMILIGSFTYGILWVKATRKLEAVLVKYLGRA